ncbi:MAG: neutral/alkaline non-lysosomal ceramidase N-terminal domain-containing protein [Chitinophagaceae bacterium]
MMYLRTFSPVLIIVMTFMLTNVVGQSKDASGWKAGVASVIITPSEPMWMAGYADRDRPSEGTLVDLRAKALVLEDQHGKRVVMVSADLVGIPAGLSNQVRQQLAIKYKLAKADVILNSSHTHTGPVLTAALVDIYPVNAIEQKKINAYTKLLGEKMVKLVGDALKILQPVQVSAGNGVTRFQVNRRNNNEMNLSKQSELKGPNDYAVPVIRVVNASGKLIAVAFGYACHNTVLNGYKFSGDYAGYAQLELEKAYPGAVALFFQGCGANQNPLPRRTVALAQQYGQELASAVTRVINEPMRILTAALSTSYAEIQLPLNAPPTREELLKRAALLTSPYQKQWSARLLKKMEAGESLMTAYPYPVQVWKLGDQPIFVLGGEVVIEYAISLKRVFGQDIFVFGYSNDVMAYIPSLGILQEGGYEGASSQMVYGLPNTWQASIETLILQQILQLAREAGVLMPGTPVN